MRYSAAGSALEAAQVLTDHLPQTLSQTSKDLYEALVWCAFERSRRLGQSPNATEATLHIPLEQLAAAVGVSRWTVQRHLPQLTARGLVDHRPHKGRLGGQARNTGTCWAVRLRPQGGRRARLSADDLRHKWRDMDADARAGRWSAKALHRIQSLESKLLRFECLLSWSLPPNTQTEPVALYGADINPLDLEAVLSVRYAPKEERGTAVDWAAKALAAALRDSSLDWYRRLLWQLLRRWDATGQDCFYPVYLAAQRARTDALEGFAKRPGALFASRLKGAPWYDEVINAPPTRVGTRPLQA